MSSGKRSARFVIFRPSALGDTLAAAPVIWALRRRFPDARIEYLSEQHTDPSVITSRQVLELIPEVDESHLYSLASGWRERLWSMRSSIAPGARDILVYLCYERSAAQEVLRDLFFFMLVGFRHFVGFRAALGNAMRGGVPDPGESEYARLFRMANSSGLRLATEASGCLRAGNDWAERFWDQHGLHEVCVVAVCPGSKLQSKRWPAALYAQVLSRLAQEKHLVFILIGNNQDRLMAEEICTATTARVVSAIGATLIQTSAILTRAQAYLGNDAGPMHMAALQGTPCVAIFSALDRVGRWHPYGAGHTVLRADVPCSGCMLQECFAMPPVCLSKINVDSVVDAVRLILERQGIPVGRKAG